MGHHESWLHAASRNVNVARNRAAKRHATFGDDDEGSVSSAVFSNPPDNQPTLTTGAGSGSEGGATTPEGVGVFANPEAGANVPTLTNSVSSQITAAVVSAGAKAMSAAGQSAAAYQQGAALAAQGASGPTLAAGLAAQAPEAQTAFNGGVALVNGAAKTVAPPGMSPAGQAGFLTAHGMVGAPPAVKGAIATALAQTPAVRGGLATGIATVSKSWWRKLLDWLHL